MQQRQGDQGGDTAQSGNTAQMPSYMTQPHLSPSERQQRVRLLRERFQWLTQFNDEELEKISFCENGAPMLPGEDYFDISHPERGAFVGRTGEVIPEGACILRKGAMPPVVWSKLQNFPRQQSR